MGETYKEWGEVASELPTDAVLCREEETHELVTILLKSLQLLESTLRDLNKWHRPASAEVAGAKGGLLCLGTP